MASTTSGLEPRTLANPAVFWVTVAGAGYLRPAPGTWGSAIAVLAWWFLLADLPMVWQCAAIAIYFLVGWALCSYVCKKYGIHDAPQIVADEVVGVWLALVFLPKIWWIALAAFVLFRVLDVAKPLAIGWLDKNVGGGLGVMADDVVAGLVAGIVLKLSLLLAGAAGLDHLTVLTG